MELSFICLDGDGFARFFILAGLVLEFPVFFVSRVATGAAEDFLSTEASFFFAGADFSTAVVFVFAGAAQALLLASAAEGFLDAVASFFFAGAADPVVVTARFSSPLVVACLPAVTFLYFGAELPLEVFLPAAVAWDTAAAFSAAALELVDPSPKIPRSCTFESGTVPKSRPRKVASARSCGRVQVMVILDGILTAAPETAGTFPVDMLIDEFGRILVIVIKPRKPSCVPLVPVARQNLQIVVKNKTKVGLS
jgi:hypothetical protein